MTKTTKAAADATPVDEEHLKKEKSALDRLLGAKEAKQTDVIQIPPREGLEDGLPLTIRSLTDREFRDLSLQAEVPVNAMNRAQRRSGDGGTEMDSSLFLRLLVAAAVVDPAFGDPNVTSKFGVNTADQVVERIMLPGEIARVAEEVMTLSGFHDNSIEYVKN